jgi:hypothetical protein
LIQIDKTKPALGKAALKSTEIRNLIQLKNEMIEDSNYRRKVAAEVVELLTDAAQVIKDDPAFFEVYLPVKVTLKVHIFRININSFVILELFARM